MATNFDGNRTFFGNVVLPEEQQSMVAVSFDDEGVLVQWPRSEDLAIGFRRNDPPLLRGMHIVKSTEGCFTFVDGYSSGTTISTLGESVERIRFQIAVATGARLVDYNKICGMQSRILGLSDWAGMSAVTSEFLFEPAEAPNVVLTAANLPDIQLTDGQIALSLKTSFEHRPAPVESVWSIRDEVVLESQSESLEDWSAHVRAHRAMQDVICMAFGEPLPATLKAVHHPDDNGFYDSGNERLWHAAYQPEFGRIGRTPSHNQLSPLFRLSEIDRAALAEWLRCDERWQRPFWIAISTLFQSHSTVEAEIIQIGVALEALGFAIWKLKEQGTGRMPRYSKLLEYVVDSIDDTVQSQYAGMEQPNWVEAFNLAFKSAKHADNALPGTLSAGLFAQSGLGVLRAWLALRLGAEPALVETRMRDAIRFDLREVATTPEAKQERVQKNREATR